MKEDSTIADEEVAEELARVTSSNDGLRVLHLTKTFGHVTAVENLTFGIKRGEVFALLGPNVSDHLEDGSSALRRKT